MNEEAGQVGPTPEPDRHRGRSGYVKLGVVLIGGEPGRTIGQ